MEAVRALIETILLEPDGDQLKITLKGDLAGMLSAARDSKRSPDTDDLLVQIKLVAGPQQVVPAALLGGSVNVKTLAFLTEVPDVRSPLG